MDIVIGALTGILTLLLGEPAIPALKVQLFQTGFSQPVLMKQVVGVDNRFYVVEQVSGELKIIENNTVLATPMIDLDNLESGTFVSEGHKGFLGLAFDPAYAANGFVYIFYSRQGGSGDHQSVISRFTANEINPDLLDIDSEEIILVIDQPDHDHNGGNIEFGSDGYLYIALGDGADPGDAYEHAQNEKTLLGSMLRIDVSTLPYSIPDTNPYFGENCHINAEDRCGEIFAVGLRSPWRWSFDRSTNDIWIGDVGQDSYEELNRIDAGTTGANLGWDCREGPFNYVDTAPINGNADCSQIAASFLEPVTYYESQTNAGGCSVTGGFVYRGSAIPKLQGKYIFGDYCNGKVRIIDADSPIGSSWQQVRDLEMFISSFAEDNAGEIYVIDYNLSGQTGSIYKIVPG